MNNVDNILNTNEVFIPPKDNENQLQSLFKIYLEIALRKAALTSLSLSNDNDNSLITDSIADSKLSSNEKTSLNIPPVSSSSNFPSSYTTPSTPNSSKSFFLRNKYVSKF